MPGPGTAVAERVSGERRLPRRNRAQTRELLLLAGALVADETVTRTDDALLGEWLSHIRLEDVIRVATQVQLYLEAHADEVAEHEGEAAREAWLRPRRTEVLAVDTSDHRGISKPTAYTVFESERDFRGQLARALLTTERAQDPSVMAAAFERLLERHGPHPPLELLVAELADVEFRRVRELESLLVELGALPFTGHPLIGELLATSLARAADPEVEGSLAALYDALLRSYGWELSGGLAVSDLVVALYGLIEGYVFFHRVWPEGVREEIPWGDGGETRGAFSLAVEGIVRQFVHPAGGTDLDGVPA
jgi:hypothetical protein